MAREPELRLAERAQREDRQVGVPRAPAGHEPEVAALADVDQQRVEGGEGGVRVADLDDPRAGALEHLPKPHAARTQQADGADVAVSEATARGRPGRCVHGDTLAAIRENALNVRWRSGSELSTERMFAMHVAMTVPLDALAAYASEVAGHEQIVVAVGGVLPAPRDGHAAGTPYVTVTVPTVAAAELAASRLGADRAARRRRVGGRLAARRRGGAGHRRVPRAGGRDGRLSLNAGSPIGLRSAGARPR